MATESEAAKLSGLDASQWYVKQMKGIMCLSLMKNTTGSWFHKNIWSLCRGDQNSKQNLGLQESSCWKAQLKIL